MSISMYAVSRTLLILPALGLIFASSTFAQSDTCSSPVTWIYVGEHAFDTTGLTSSGFEVSQNCTAGQRNSFGADGFIHWYVPYTGRFQFDTNGTEWDTQLAIYDGPDCTATCLASDDDSGIGRRSLVRAIPLVEGQLVLIQIGGYGDSQGPGILNITPYEGICSTTLEDRFDDNDTCFQATPLVNGVLSRLYVSSTDKDHYSFCVRSGRTVFIDMFFPSDEGNLDAVLWDASDVNCGTSHSGLTFLAEGSSISDDETLNWTNNTGQNINVVLEVNVATQSALPCNTYQLVLAGSGCGGDIGSTFCNATNNSTGMPAALTGTWGSAIGSDLHLEVTHGPSAQIGYFLIGNTDASPGIAISNGQFCLVGTQGAIFARYNVAGSVANSIGRFDAGGDLQNLVLTSTVGTGFDVPASVAGGAPISAGTTWHFQCWFRDNLAGSGTSNFTNGLSVMF